MTLPTHRIVEENLRAAMSCFARSQPGGEALDLAGLRVVYTGVRQAIFNAVLLKESAVTTTDFRRRIDRAKDYFARRGFPWSLWLCEDLLHAELRAPIRSLIYDSGLIYSSSAPGMFIDRLAQPSRALPKLDYRPISDTTTRLDFCHVMSMSYEAPFATIIDAYSHEEFWTGEFQGLLGYRGDQAITTACTVPAAGAVGLYAVATIPSEQRQGYGEAVMREAVAHAHAQTGFENVVLQSTRSGLALYRQMGFEHVADFTIYVSAE